MSVHRRLAGAAVALLTPALLAAVPVPAHARPGDVHLVVTVSGPVLSDHLALGFAVTVANLGPGTATGITTTQDTLNCPTDSGPLSDCTTDYPVLARMADLPAGSSHTYLAVVELAGTRLHVVRTTFQVAHVDQHDVASVPGTCDHGLNPQPDCATVVTDLRR